MKNSQLLERRSAAVPNGIVTGTPIFAARAKNAELWDVEGRRYIDFGAGIATLNTGHCHPRVIDAVRRQLDLFTHTAFQVVGYEGYVALCERLNTLAPIKGSAKAVLFSTGGEATENAIKIARRATQRSAVISFAGAFHGRSLLGTAMTGKVAGYKEGFGPMPGDVHHAMFPVDHRGISVEQAMASLSFLFETTVAPNRVAAIIVEPVQGEGGFNPAPAPFLEALRECCDTHGIMLVFDEVQTGFCRTGKMFAAEHSGVTPDLIAVAKSLGGGFPIAGVVGRAEVMDMVHPGGLGSTFGGSPIACAAALAVLDVLEDEGLAHRANVVGERIMSHLRSLECRNDLLPIANIRGVGAMVAFDVLRDRSNGDYDGSSAKRLTARAAQLGLLLLTCGPAGETVRILTPLTIEMETLEEGLALLTSAMGIADTVPAAPQLVEPLV